MKKRRESKSAVTVTRKTMKVLEFIDRTGINKTVIGENSRRSNSWVTGIKRATTTRPLLELSEVLIKHGQILEKFSFKKNDLEETLDAAGWKLTGLAERLGWTRQWLCSVIRNGHLTEERSDLIEREVRKFGQEMIEHGLSLLSAKKAA